MQHPTETTTWWSAQDFADEIGCAKNTIEGKRSRGEDLPPYYQITKKCVRYKKAEVLEWIESKRKIPAAVVLAEAGA